MFSYTIYCTMDGCSNPACFKIAARWSDGKTAELKTYALVCEDCAAAALKASREKQAAYRLGKTETMEPSGIYEIQQGTTSQELPRRTDLEEQICGPAE